MGNSYVLYNRGNAPVRLDSGEVIEACSLGATFYNRDALFEHFEEFRQKGLRVFRLSSVLQIKRRGMGNQSHPAVDLGLYDSGDDGPSGKLAEVETKPTVRGVLLGKSGARKASAPLLTAPPAPEGWMEAVPGRLYCVEAERWNAAHVSNVTIVVDLTAVGVELGNARLLRVTWPAEENVDEGVLEGLVRFCSSAMKGVDQRVVLVGSLDAITTVAACVLKEYLGLDGASALAVLRATTARGLAEPALIQTVDRYRPS